MNAIVKSIQNVEDDGGKVYKLKIHEYNTSMQTNIQFRIIIKRAIL